MKAATIAEKILKKSAMHMPLPAYPHESPRKVFYCLNEHVHTIKNVLYNWNHLLKLFFFLDGQQLKKI